MKLLQHQHYEDMKRRYLLMTGAMALLTPLAALAGDDHAKKEAGPNGGRLITAVEPHLELLVTKDRKVKITFLDEKKQAVEPGDKTVKLTCGERANPVRMTFQKGGKSLVSKELLPEGKNFPAVLQVKTDGKPVFERFQMNLMDCPECDYLEYACTCDHEH